MPARLLISVAITSAVLGAPTAASASTSTNVTILSDRLPSASRLEGIVAGPERALWFADPGTGAIGRVDPATHRVEEFKSGLNPGSLPHEIARGQEGKLWFTDDGSTKAIGRIGPVTHRIEEFSAGLKPDSRPGGIAAGPEGDMWFTDQGEAKAIGHVGPSGAITEYALDATYPRVAAQEIALGRDGNLWFTGGASGSIGAIDPGSGRVQLGGGDMTEGIVGAPDGRIWYAERGFYKELDVIDPAQPRPIGWKEERFAAGLNPYSLPTELALGPEGDVWFTDQGPTKAVGRIDPSNDQIEEFATGEFTPDFIALGPDGKIWFTAGSALGVVSPPAAPHEPGPPVESHQPRPPRTASVSRLRLRPAALVAARGRGRAIATTPRSGRVRRGAVVSFVEVAPTVVVFTVERRAGARRAAGHCRLRLRLGARCLVRVVIGRFAYRGKAGRNSFVFTGRVNGRPLAPGRYRLKATPAAPSAMNVAAYFDFAIAR